MGYLNISSDKSNEIPMEIPERQTAPTITNIKTEEEVLEDKIVPVTGFTRAMVKSMTEAMVNL